MKILSISLKNLASFAREVTLDFRTPPLVHAGVFAIIGPTGSGKSTLLDALCLALYGCTPRSKESNQAKLQVEGESELWTAKDPRQLVRRGVTDAFAKVVFEANGAVYESTWRCRRATKGKLSLSTEVSLTHDGEVICNNKTSLDNQIKALTGLDFDGFCRSVLLPQGRFEKFLTSGPDDRAALLESLTDPTGLYRGVSALAHERGSAWATRISEAKVRVDAVVVLSDEVRAESEARLGALEEEFAQVDAATQVIGSELARLDAVVTASAVLHGRKAELHRCMSACREGEPKRRLLEDARAAKGLRETGRRRDDAARRVIELEREAADLEGKHADAKRVEESATSELSAAERAHADAATLCADLRPQLDQARALDASLAQNREARAKSARAVTEAEASLHACLQTIEAHERRQRAVEARIREVDAWMSSHPSAATLLDSRSAWTSALEDFAAGRESAARAQEALSRLRDREARCVDVALQASKVHAEAERVSEEARVAKAAASARADAHRERNLHERREGVAQRLKRVEDLLSRLKARSTERSEVDRLTAESAALEVERARLGAERAERTADVIRLEEAVKKAERDFIVSQTRASMAQHRAALVDGEPCSVCGSTTHPWADPRALPHQDDSNRAELEAARSAAVQALHACERALAVESERAGRAAHSATQLRSSLEQARPSLEAECAALELSTAVDDHALLDATLSLRDTLSSEHADLVDASKAAEAAASEEHAAQERWHKCTTDLNDALSRAVTARGERDTVIADRVREEERVAESQDAIRKSEARVADALRDVPGAVEVFQADPRGQLQRWSMLAEACEAQRHAVARDHKEAVELKCELEPLTAARVQAETKRDMLRAEEVGLQVEHGELASARGAVFGGRATDEVDREAQRSLEACRARVEGATSCVQAERESLALIEGKRQNAVGALARQREDALLSLREHEALLASLDLDEAEAARRLALSEAELGELERQLNELDAAARAAGRLLEEAEVALAAAEAQRPARDREALEAELGRLKTLQETLRTEQADCRSVLKHDLDQRGERAKRELELEAVRREGGVWGMLAELIGSHDGSLFALYAQSLAFDSLLASANEHLARLHPRYALRRIVEAAEEASGKRMKQALLEMVIEDRELGDIIRPVSTLSGGERFLVSLSLALGLSSLASQRRKLASMFIDEGFGTLDPEFLGTVISVLDALQASGTRVGVISHVAELKERLQAQVIVERRGDGTSTLRIVG